MIFSDKKILEELKALRLDAARLTCLVTALAKENGLIAEFLGPDGGRTVLSIRNVDTNLTKFYHTGE